jgi:hypothetical protein
MRTCSTNPDAIIIPPRLPSQTDGLCKMIAWLRASSLSLCSLLSILLLSKLYTWPLQFHPDKLTDRLTDRSESTVVMVSRTPAWLSLSFSLSLSRLLSSTVLLITKRISGNAEGKQARIMEGAKKKKEVSRRALDLLAKGKQ